MSLPELQAGTHPLWTKMMMNATSISGRCPTVLRQRPSSCIQSCAIRRLRSAGQHQCRALEKESSADTDSRLTVISSTSISSTDEDTLSRTEVQKLSELRREQQRGQSQANIVQGAIEEAQLITWPTPKKAFFDTILVLTIVSASGSLLFGLNVVLAEASEWWYHIG